MASSAPRRSASRRATLLPLRPAQWQRWWEQLTRTDVLVRIGLCLLATVAVWLITSGWAPPFAYRTGYVPRRDIVARVTFAVRDEDGTRQRKDEVRRKTISYYENDPKPLADIQQHFTSSLEKLLSIAPDQPLPSEVAAEFFPPRDGDAAPSDVTAIRKQVKDSLSGAESFARLVRVVAELIDEFQRNGLLNELDARDTSVSPGQAEIRVHLPEKLADAHVVAVDAVKLAVVRQTLEKRVADGLRSAQLSDMLPDVIGRLTADWIGPHLPVTLKYNAEATALAREEAAQEVERNPVMVTFEQGRSTLVEGGKPIDLAELRVLLREHQEVISRQSVGERIGHSLASFGIYLALYVLCGMYLYSLEPRILRNVRQFVPLLAAVVTTIAAAWIAAHDQWRAESIPLLLFGLTAAIVYQRELAILLSAAVALLVTLALGQGLAQFVIHLATLATAVLALGRIRSRTRLIYVGLGVAIVGFLITLCICTLVGQAYGARQLLRTPLVETPDNLERFEFLNSLLNGAVWSFLCAILASILMTGLLPFIERLFDVQTDISLLELGDARHPLLQELVRRAPGTYNHSINVASIGEAAAEAIGANGLLVRVGAYFHDIGKMLKPQYFIENQGQEGNRHLSLLPAMSTLVIIAHVKDGVNLARQHRLPQSIIDFIEQHHGTTLVEYFYRQAAKQFEADPDGTEVDETHFRYPGPKPQSKETAVLMLSDAVESASRTLVEPTPSRIENLVNEIAMKRLLDGQFSECGLTLDELRTIENSLVKSLSAVYHGRVKYPDQQPA